MLAHPLFFHVILTIRQLYGKSYGCLFFRQIALLWLDLGLIGPVLKGKYIAIPPYTAFLHIFFRLKAMARKAKSMVTLSLPKWRKRL